MSVLLYVIIGMCCLILALALETWLDEVDPFTVFFTTIASALWPIFLPVLSILIISTLISGLLNYIRDKYM